MNYFGHAVMAHEYRPDPAFVLGAMLPDLMHFSDEPLGVLQDPALLAGVAFHHRTDALFHATPTFVELCRHALEGARHAGVSKGPARGMTHLVVELCIDAKLAEVSAWQAAYLAALAVRPPDLSQRKRLREGLDWLTARGPGLHNATSERLAVALGVTLGKRPRLAPSEDELRGALEAWTDLPSRVEAGLPGLLRELAPLLTEAWGDAELVFSQHSQALDRGI